jgi:hypothetical protein
VYLIVNAAFFMIGLFTHGLPDTLMPGVFWGIGLGIHALRAFMADEDEWVEARDKQRQIEAKRRRREERAEAVGRVVDKGVSLLLGDDKGDKRSGRRIDAAGKIRFATSGQQRRAEAEAEADAVAEEIEARRRGRR